MAQPADNLPPAGARMKAAEYFQYPESALPIELINGVVMRWPMPLADHQRLLGELAFAINKLSPEGEVFYSALDLYLDDENVVQPDVAWVATNSRCTIGEKRLEGAPDLIVEVLSPGTARHDKTVKFLLYEKHGLREYWLIEPTRREIEVWQLAEGEFVRQGIYGETESFPSAVLGGKTVEVSAIFSG